MEPSVIAIPGSVCSAVFWVGEAEIAEDVPNPAVSLIRRWMRRKKR